MFEQFFYPQKIDSDSDFMPMISIDEEEEPNETEIYPEELPVLALKNTVLFPSIIIPITVGRDKSIKAINEAYDTGRMIAVLSQKDSKVETPKTEDLYQKGTIARIVKLLRMPDGTITAILQGRTRFELVDMIEEHPILRGRVEVLQNTEVKDKLRFQALVESIKDLAKQIIELSPNIPSEAVGMLSNIKSDNFLLNFIASNLAAETNIKQDVLEINDLNKKAEYILELMDNELQLLELKDQIESKVRTDIEKQQRDFFLNQQLKTIQEELGQNPNGQELAELKARAEEKKWPQAVQEAFEKQITKAARINPQVAEYSVILNYLDLLLELPWLEYTEDNFDLQNVKKVLDKDHCGLEKVKERILEHLAVL